MNDPHVVALVYRVEPDPSVGYSQAEALQHETPNFRVMLDKGIARFEMKDHYPTEEAARAVVEPFIEAWQLKADLERRPGRFRLTLQEAELIDRNPLPNTVTIGMAIEKDTALPIRPYVEPYTYPPPPEGFAVNPDVRSMFHRFFGYREGKEPLAAMAYFCLTVLSAAKKGKLLATGARYRIDPVVLEKLSELSSVKGGPEARKAIGAGKEFTPPERVWIEGAVKAIIRRAGEVAHDPGGSHSTITMADLPPL